MEMRSLETFMTSSLWDPDDGPFFILTFTGDRLDPAPLIDMLGSIKSGKPKRKGEPTAQAVAGRTTPTAKTGVCTFWTAGHVASVDPNDHLSFLLNTITPHIAHIKTIMAEYGLQWDATIFDADEPSATLPSLAASLTEQAAALSLPLRAERET